MRITGAIVIAVLLLTVLGAFSQAPRIFRMVDGTLI